MTTDVEQLQLIRSQTLAQLQSLSQQPKPTYSIEGQTIRWEEYARSLQSTVDWCDQQLAGKQPFEVRSEGRTP